MQCRFELVLSAPSSGTRLFLTTTLKQSIRWQLIGCYLLLAAGLFFIPVSQPHADSSQNSSKNETLYFGLLPYLSPATLMKTWRPFADYFEETLHKKVVIKTAPNFTTFIERTKAGRYHVLMTAPHLAALAVKNNGYRIIAGHDNDLAGDIVVAENSRFQTINDLRGKTFAIPGRIAAVSMLAELLLMKNGLTPNKDIRIKISTAHDTALIAVAEGLADAAVAVGGLYRRINAGKKFPQLRKLTTTEKIPHVMYIANPSLSDEDFRTLQLALTQPAPNSKGASLISNLGTMYNWGRITMPSQENIDRLKPVLSLLEAQNIQNE